MNTQPAWLDRLTVRGAAARLGIAVSTFYLWRATGELDAVTHHTPTGRPYWFGTELDAWLRSRWSAHSTPDQGRDTVEVAS